MSTPNDIARLRAQLQRLKNDTLTSNTSLSNINATIEEKIAAVNQGVGAVAASVLNVSSSLSVSLEQASTALQASLEANAGAILILSSSTSSSISQSAALIQSGLTSLGGSLYDVSSSLSTSLSESAQALRLSLAANASAVIQLSQSTSMSLSQSAAALREGLVAVAGTVYDVSSSLSTSVEESGRLLRNSLTNLVNQNSESFKSRLDGLDGELDGVVNNVTIITGSWNDFTSSTNTNLGTLNTFKNDNVSKLSSLAATPQQEQQQASQSVGTANSIVEILKQFNYNSSFLWSYYTPPSNYWAYTVSYPTGANPFSIKSYSYMGTNGGTKYWNLEEIISYSKREYSINSIAPRPPATFDYNNTMNKDANNNPLIVKDSELVLKGGKITLRKGFEDTTTTTVEIVGEGKNAFASDLQQGQLLIRDEDSTTSGLQLGFIYDAGSETTFGRIQTISDSTNPTKLYINKQGGNVEIGNIVSISKDLQLTSITGKLSTGRINNHAISNGSMELNYYGSGDRNTFIDFHSDNTYGFSGNNTAPTDGDYSGRIIRGSGVNGVMEIVNRGAGGIRNTVINGTGNIFDWYVGTSRLMYLNNNGSLTIAGAYAPSSDERIKTDILTSSLGLDFINNLNPVQFKFIVADEIIDLTKEKLENNKIVNDGSRKAGIRNHYGFIAQEVKKAAGDRDFAAVIYEPEKDLYKLNHQEFISPMVKAIQELSQKNDYLEKKLEEKEKQLQDILSRLTALENK